MVDAWCQRDDIICKMTRCDKHVKRGERAMLVVLEAHAMDNKLVSPDPTCPGLGAWGHGMWDLWESARCRSRCRPRHPRSL
jgi:hypothetical protein